ncbi:tetratricopeptide repeat protein [Kiritimatiellota bacterium B12222]|nr:tetratricopeptide repeat protein [Kiritimatiellota bacterium B12222]
MKISKIWDRLSKVELWLVVAVVLRGLYLIEQSTFSPLYDQLSLDELEVSEMAKAILSGTVDKIPLYKAPFYSWYLAFMMKVSGSSWFLWVRVGQHLAGVLLIWMAVDCTRIILRGRQKQTQIVCVALVAAFLALYAPLLRLENRIVLDFWTVFFQSALLWSLFKWIDKEASSKKWILSAGLFSALAWLNRPTLTLVFPFLLVWVFYNGIPSKRKILVPIFALPLLVCVLGMGAWNQQVSGERLFLPWQGGYDLWMSNRPEANGRYLVQNSYVISQTANPTFEMSQSEYLAAVKLGETPPAATHQFYKSLNKYWVNKTMTYAMENPWEWLSLYLKKNFYLVNQEEIYSFESYETQKEISSVLKWLPPLGFGFVFPLALTGWIWWKKRDSTEKAQFLLLWTYAVTLSAATALYYASGRMRMPLIFPAVILAVESLAYVIETWKDPQAKAKRLSLFFGLLCIGIILSWGDWWGVRSEEFRDKEYLRLSSAFYAKGQAESALDYALRAEKINPDYPTLPLLKGQALYALGRHDEAVGSFQESIRRLPNAFEAYYNLGVIYWYYQDEGEKALDPLRAVLSNNPTHGQAAALASIASGLYGSMEESVQFLKLAQESSPPQKSMMLEVAEIAFLTRQGHTEEVNLRLKELWNKYPEGNTRKMLLDDLQRAQVISVDQ